MLSPPFPNFIQYYTYVMEGGEFNIESSQYMATNFAVCSKTYTPLKQLVTFMEFVNLHYIMQQY